MRDFLLSFLVTIALLAPEPLAVSTTPDATVLGRSRSITMITIKGMITVEETIMIRLIYREPSGVFHIVEARRLLLVTVQQNETVRLELRLDETMVLPIVQVHPAEQDVLQTVYDYLVRQIEAGYLSDRVINLNRILNGIGWRGTLQQI